MKVIDYTILTSKKTDTICKCMNMSGACCGDLLRYHRK